MNLVDKNGTVLTKIMFRANDHDVIEILEVEGNVLVVLDGYRGRIALPLQEVITYSDGVVGVVGAV